MLSMIRLEDENLFVFNQRSHLMATMLLSLTLSICQPRTDICRLDVHLGLLFGLKLYYSNAQYLHILFRTCGNDGWPQNGEIDIIEYVNTDSIDATTLHTDAGCDQGGVDTNSFTGFDTQTLH